MKKLWPLCLLLPLFLLAQSQPSPTLALPEPCPPRGPCLAPEDWRLAWLSSVKEKRWILYDVSEEHLRQEEKERWSGPVTLFLRDAERLLAKGGTSNPAGYGCPGKLPRPSFTSQALPADLGKGSWALVTPGEQPLAAVSTPRTIGKRLKPELIPITLQSALNDWKRPAWAEETTVIDAVLPIELDGDEDPEYWVTRTYRRAQHQDPALRMFSSWAIFDLAGSAKMLFEEPEEECDCLCRDGGCGCCRWDEVTTSPQALFDADLDGFSEVVLERHQRVGIYRYELWRFDGKKFYKTRLSYEDGGC
jgi:hypothetical protein